MSALTPPSISSSWSRGRPSLAQLPYGRSHLNFRGVEGIRGLIGSGISTSSSLDACPEIQNFSAHLTILWSDWNSHFSFANANSIFNPSKCWFYSRCSLQGNAINFESRCTFAKSLIQFDLPNCIRYRISFCLHKFQCDQDFQIVFAFTSLLPNANFRYNLLLNHIRYQVSFADANFAI